MDRWSSGWGTEERRLENRAGVFADLEGRAGRWRGVSGGLCGASRKSVEYLGIATGLE